MRIALFAALLLGCGSTPKSDTADTGGAGTTPTNPTTSGPTTTPTGASTTVDPLPVEPRRCTGFAASPDVWGMPEDLSNDGTTYSADGQGQYWSAFDVTGDGLPDLMELLHDNRVAGDLMGEAWYVWPGTGAGFGDRIEWTLPLDHRDLDGLHAANSSQTVVDLDGDGFPDLVRAQDPETLGLFDGGVWHVHRGDGATGFAVEPTPWTLPADLLDPIAVFDGDGHHVVDIDGDGALELVRTQGDDGFVFGHDGSPHWRVHDIDGTGFAEAYTEWPVPELRKPYDWANWWDTYAGLHAVVDVSGDGRPDLVATQQAVAPFGVYGADLDWHWRVHLNTGTGFEADHRQWSLPDPYFDFVGGPSARVEYPITARWRVMPIGDGTPVLVVTQDPDTDAGWVEDGTPIWAVFDATGEGYTDLHDGWALPDTVYTEFFENGNDANPGWFLSDLDADGCADLVLTTGPGVPNGDDREWWVYRAL